MNDIELTLQALRDAAEAVRAANHAAYDASSIPSDMYLRLVSLVEVLGYLPQAVGMLATQLGRVHAAETPDTDDDKAPLQHVETANLCLATTESLLKSALSSANTAFSAVSHLKPRTD